MKLVSLLLISGTLLSCGPVTFPLDAQGPGLRSPEAGEVLGMSPAWSIKMSETSHFAPVTGADLLFVLGDGGLLQAVSSGGQVVWEASLGSPPSGPPTLSGSLVLAATRSGQATAFDQISGKVLWKKDLNEEAGSPASWGEILALPLKTRMVALRNADGLLLWESPHTGASPLPAWTFSGARPVSWKGQIIHPDKAGTVRSWDAATGRLVWEAVPDRTGIIPYPGLWTPLFTQDGLVIFHSRRQAVVLNPDTGGFLGSLHIPRDLSTEPGTDGKRVFIPARAPAGHLIAMTFREGTHWETTLKGSSGSWINTASVHGSLLAAGGSDSHTLYFMDPASGRELGRYRSTSRFWSAPIWSKDRLCLLTEDGRLTALDLFWKKAPEAETP